MDKEQSKKIYVTVYKLIAIIVSIFVFSYAWFVHESDNNLEGVNIGTAKTNNINAVYKLIYKYFNRVEERK